MKNAIVAVAVAAVLTTGCATAPRNIMTNTAPPGSYGSYTCEALATERYNREKELDRQVRSQKKQHITDLATFWTGLVIAWPAIFVPIFTPDYEDEIAKNRGLVEAVDIQLIKKDCG